MFWLAHKDEQNQCKIEGDYASTDTKKSDLQNETNTSKYKHYQYTSGVVVKLVKYLFLKSN
jgi:hypothetical protein